MSEVRYVQIVKEIDLQADLDDRVSLATFSDLWWAGQRAGSEDPARFLDNKQAAIRMLRRNHAGFPAPVTASSRTQLFRLGDLAEWAVKAHNIGSTAEEAIKHRSALVGVEWHLDRAIDACAAELEPDEARRLAVLIVMALDQSDVAPGVSRLPAGVRTLIEDGAGLPRLLRGLTVRRADAPPGLADAVKTLSDGLPASIDSTARLARTMTASLLAGNSAAEVADHALDRCETQISAAPQRRTGEGLAMLMLAAARPNPGEHIVDLAAGEAGLLISAADRIGGAARLTGIEMDPVTWAIGRCRLHLHRLSADFRKGDSLEVFASLPTGDLVLLDPPVDNRRQYVRWLAAAATVSGESGRAVVSLPALTADPGRREWMDVGKQRCVFLVKCPARLRMDRGAPLVIWGLAGNPGENLLVVDASRLGMSRAGLRDIDDVGADSLRDLLEQWEKKGGTDADPPLEVAALPRAVFGGLSADMAFRTMTDKPMGMMLRDRGEISDAMTDALGLAERLADYLDDELRPYTAEQHRRAIQGLAQRLRAQVQMREMQRL